MYWSGHFSSYILYRVLSGALSKFEASKVVEACKMGLSTAMAGPSRKEQWATEVKKGRLSKFCQGEMLPAFTYIAMCFDLPQEEDYTPYS